MQIELPYRWNPRSYQQPAWQYFQRDLPGLRGVCVWHRRAGKDLMGINMISTKIPQRVGLYWHLLPTIKQGRQIVWDGFTKEGRRFIDHFHPLTVKKKVEDEMRIHFHNGAIYQVAGTDDINRLVGTNPVGVILSEYSLHDPMAWTYLQPILRENGGWALFIMTPRGRNHGYTLFKMAKDNPDWFCETRVAGNGGTKLDNGNPVITDEMINADRMAGMPEEMIQQEYYCSFTAAMVGAYYGSLIEQAVQTKRVTGVPYDPMLTVDTFWDLGMRDDTTIIFAQRHGLEIRIIDFYASNQNPLRHYRDILAQKGYTYGDHCAPHDIAVRELTSGRSRLEVARELGIKFKVTPKHELMDGIENVRNILPLCWFDEVKADNLLEAMKSYRREYDEKNKCYKPTPLHDWSSHAADAFRVMAWHYRRSIRRQAPMQHTAIDNFSYI